MHPHFYQRDIYPGLFPFFFFESSSFEDKLTLSSSKDKGNWSQRGKQHLTGAIVAITIMIAAAEGQRVTHLFLMVLTGLRMVVNGRQMIDELSCGEK